jgi:hypothetical protein
MSHHLEGIPRPHAGQKFRGSISGPETQRPRFRALESSGAGFAHISPTGSRTGSPSFDNSSRPSRLHEAQRFDAALILAQAFAYTPFSNNQDERAHRCVVELAEDRIGAGADLRRRFCLSKLFGERGQELRESTLVATSVCADFVCTNLDKLAHPLLDVVADLADFSSGWPAGSSTSQSSTVPIKYGHVP